FARTFHSLTPLCSNATCTLEIVEGFVGIQILAVLVKHLFLRLRMWALVAAAWLTPNFGRSRIVRLWNAHKIALEGDLPSIFALQGVADKRSIAETAHTLAFLFVSMISPLYVPYAKANASPRTHSRHELAIILPKNSKPRPVSTSVLHSHIPVRAPTFEISTATLNSTYTSALVTSRPFMLRAPRTTLVVEDGYAFLLVVEDSGRRVGVGTRSGCKKIGFQLWINAPALKSPSSRLVSLGGRSLRNPETGRGPSRKSTAMQYIRRLSEYLQRKGVPMWTLKDPQFVFASPRQVCAQLKSLQRQDETAPKGHLMFISPFYSDGSFIEFSHRLGCPGFREITTRG
ncbi:LOW QUALITY PROTEIN: hypothetical protein CVT26_005779, partial [Gymnopilus dilepis]